MFTESEKAALEIAIVSSIEDVQEVIAKYKAKKLNSIALTTAEEQLASLRSALAKIKSQ